MSYRLLLLTLTLFLSACTTTQPVLTDSYLYHEQLQHQKHMDRDMKDRISTERILEQVNSGS